MDAPLAVHMTEMKRPYEIGEKDRSEASILALETMSLRSAEGKDETCKHDDGSERTGCLTLS